MTNNKNFNVNVSNYSWDDFSYVERENFVDSLNSNSVEVYVPFRYNGKRLNVLDDIAKASGLNYTYKMTNSDIGLISFYDNNKLVMLVRVSQIAVLDLFKPISKQLYAYILGSKEYVEKLAYNISNEFPVDKKATIHWSFNTSQGIKHKIFALENKYPVRNEYYPWLGTDVYKYFEDYMNSDASILILLGEPGTGKTSFIRNLITQNALSVTVTYDSTVMETDEFYMEFLDGKNDLMVFEDAESLLLPRESENKIMSRLLNTSDGIISLPQKKIIFTANVTNENKIDQALMRTGRCFDVINFRPLKRDEAQKVAEIEGIELKYDCSEYTLSDIFSSRKNGKKFQKKIGF